ncbi:hypothetical protein CPC08DRAFT_717697 [Agrocybe pediades]|nr:hypothetical protein CPC08DRAFT_717697 [Agrocybe pediades]
MPIRLQRVPPSSSTYPLLLLSVFTERWLGYSSDKTVLIEWQADIGWSLLLVKSSSNIVVNGRVFSMKLSGFRLNNGLSQRRVFKPINAV